MVGFTLYFSQDDKILTYAFQTLNQTHKPQTIPSGCLCVRRLDKSSIGRTRTHINMYRSTNTHKHIHKYAHKHTKTCFISRHTNTLKQIHKHVQNNTQHYVGAWIICKAQNKPRDQTLNNFVQFLVQQVIFESSIVNTKSSSGTKTPTRLHR